MTNTIKRKLRRWARPAGLTIALGVGPSACDGAGAVRGDVVEMDSHPEAQIAKPAVTALYAKVTDVTYSGSLCPPESTLMAFGDRTPGALTILTSASEFSFTGRETSRSCTMSIELVVPTGYQFSKVKFILMHTLWENDKGLVAGKSSTVYSYDKTQTATHDWALSENNALDLYPVELWSPCSTGKPIRLQVALTTTLTGTPGGKGTYTWTSLDADFLQKPSGLEWRKCS